MVSTNWFAKNQKLSYQHLVFPLSILRFSSQSPIGKWMCSCPQLHFETFAWIPSKLVQFVVRVMLTNKDLVSHRIKEFDSFFKYKSSQNTLSSDGCHFPQNGKLFSLISSWISVHLANVDHLSQLWKPRYVWSSSN